MILDNFSRGSKFQSGKSCHPPQGQCLSADRPHPASSGTGTGTNPYAYAQNLGYSGTQEQFNVAYMNAIGLTERSTGYVVFDGGGANVDTFILDGGDADDFIN